MQFGAARGPNPFASPRARRNRPGEIRVQVQVNDEPHRQLHPLPGAAGNSRYFETRDWPAGFSCLQAGSATGSSGESEREGEPAAGDAEEVSLGG